MKSPLWIDEKDPVTKYLLCKFWIEENLIVHSREFSDGRNHTGPNIVTMYKFLDFNVFNFDFNNDCAIGFLHINTNDSIRFWKSGKEDWYADPGLTMVKNTIEKFLLNNKLKNELEKKAPLIKKKVVKV